MFINFFVILFGPFIIIAIAMLVAFFGTGLVICLYNVSEGRKVHWPIKHIVGASIGGFIAMIPIGMLIAAALYHFLQAFYFG